MRVVVVVVVVVVVLLIVSRCSGRGTEDFDFADVQIVARILFPNPNIATSHGDTARHSQGFSGGNQRGGAS